MHPAGERANLSGCEIPQPGKPSHKGRPRRTPTLPPAGKGARPRLHRAVQAHRRRPGFPPGGPCETRNRASGGASSPTPTSGSPPRLTKRSGEVAAARRILGPRGSPAPPDGVGHPREPRQRQQRAPKGDKRATAKAHRATDGGTPPCLHGQPEVKPVTQGPPPAWHPGTQRGTGKRAVGPAAGTVMTEGASSERGLNAGVRPPARGVGPRPHPLARRLTSRASTTTTRSVAQRRPGDAEGARPAD